MAQKDSVFGMVSHAFPIFEDGINQTGTIYVCEKGLVVKHNGLLIRSPFSYVRKIEKVEEQAMGRYSVILKLFDQVGGEYDMAVSMTDSSYMTLRKLCPNAEPKEKKE